MDLFKSIFTFKVPSWITIVETFMAFVFCLLFALYTGGETEQEIAGKNGAEYLVNFEINDGILNLIEKCQLKEVGESCEVKVGLRFTLKSTPKDELIDDADVEKSDGEETENPDIDQF